MKNFRKKINLKIQNLIIFCNENGIELTKFYSKSFRLKKEGFVTINYFPKSDRVFYYDTEKWDDVADMIPFLTAYYINPTDKKPVKKSKYQELFNYMKDEHSVTLLEQDMIEICNIVKKIE